MTQALMKKCDVPRAAEIMNKTPMAIYQDVHRRKIPYRRMGRTVFFFEEELYDFLAQQPGVSVKEAIEATA